MHLSATQIGMFLRCERQWYYRYVEGLRVPPPGALILGGAYHDGVEHALSVKLETGSLPPVDECLDAYRDAWEHQLNVEEEIDWGEDAPSVLLDHGASLVGEYVKGVAPGIEPVAVEAGFSLPYDIPVVGFVDLVHESKNGPVLVEHKTSKRKGGLERYGLQMGIYKIALKKDWGIEPTDARVHQAIVGRGDIFIDAVPIEEEKMVDLLIRSIIEKINYGLFAPTGIGSWVCTEKWCGYYRICRERR